MIEDAELLRRYACESSQEAFAELVRRRIGLVYTVALRHTNDPHRAEDVTQTVFTALARKAEELARRPVLVGWLFRSAQFAASDAVRAEVRRQAREQEANTMQQIDREAPEPDWNQLRPILDEVLNQLEETDRDAILLRYFDGATFGAVGTRLRLSENAARMRVERAVDKLRALLARRGVDSTSAALALVLANQPVAAAPAGLAAAVTSAALAATGIGAAAGAALGTGSAVTVAAAGTGAGTWATFMSMTKLQMALAGVVAAGAATGLALQASDNAQLRREVAALQQQNQELAALRARNLELTRNAAAVAEFRNDDAALGQLRDESATLRSRMQRVARAEEAKAAKATVEQPKLDRQPRLTSSVPPRYPDALRQAGITGEVLVDFIVDNQGNVRVPRAVQSSVAGEKMELTERTDVVRMVPMKVAGEKPSGSATLNGVPVADVKKLLEESAIEAVSQWKFDSGLKGGRAVNTHMQMPIVFSLTNE